MSKIITVFGSTEPQGHSLILSLLKDHKYTIRAVVTRKTSSSDQASKLRDLGVQLFETNLDDRQSIATALEGAYGCFLYTETDFGASNPEEREYQQGENVVDVAMVKKVQHIVFSTLPSVRQAIGISAANCDAKARINDYINERELPRTSVIFPFSYQNLTTVFKPKKLQQHVYGLGIPMLNTSINMFDVNQAGPLLHYIFDNPAQTMNKTFNVVGDKLRVDEIAQIFAKVLKPNEFKDMKMQVEEFRRLPGEGIEDLGNMFEYFARHDLRFNMETTKKMLPNVKNFEQWVVENKTSLYAILN
ncbi:nmrA-like family domain-containing protein 1 [Lytechinus variegatus]|uniref:nmrA-like family domain-containing protein 1 n=1 Tax=Lytechinus variegatus TaxID=7654 RepID=UPI001BB1B211|nr:nmrA-like family domain-containing protein 1 [Lytechinus variegatus]XP_041481729.1 nmrA-like family domain-containing protein 1 [Lytechinus variegatus]